MAVLIEAISVVVRRNRIDELFPGGWDGFISDTTGGARHDGGFAFESHVVLFS